MRLLSEQREKFIIPYFAPVSKYRTVKIIAELAIIAIIMNQFIVRDGAGAIGVVALGIGVSSEAGVGEGKWEGVGEGEGKV